MKAIEDASNISSQRERTDALLAVHAKVEGNATLRHDPNFRESRLLLLNLIQTQLAAHHSNWSPFESMEEALMTLLHCTGPGLSERNMKRVIEMLRMPNFDAAKVPSFSRIKKVLSTIPKLEIKSVPVAQIIDRRARRRSKKGGQKGAVKRGANRGVTQDPEAKQPLPTKQLDLHYVTLESIIKMFYAHPHIAYVFIIFPLYLGYQSSVNNQVNS